MHPQHRPSAHHAALASGAALALALAGGCGSQQAPTLFPVTLRVVTDQRPMPGAQIVIRDRPQGTTDAQGSFRMRMTGAEGAVVRLSGGNELHCAVDATVAAAGDKMTLGIRPEHICLDAGTNTIEAEVAFVESLGSTTHAYCAYPGTDDLTCTLDGRNRPGQGDRLTLGFPAEVCYLFDARGNAFRRHA